MATFSSELRLAVRSLARRPGFAAVAVGTIALAVAANTAMFSIVNAVLLRPLPFPAAEELVLIDSRGTTGFLASISIPNYRDWRNRSRVFHSFSASAPWGLTLTGRGQAEVLEVEALLGDVFGTLRLRPLLGRLPTAAETEPGSEAAAVLSYGFWQNRFGGDPAILGQTMVLDERPYVIIGVLPAGAGFPSPEVQVYVPMGTLPDLPWNDRDSGFGTRAIARLAPGVTLDAARRDLQRVGREVREIAGAHASQPELRSLIAYYLDDVRRPLWVLMGAVTFVLLVAVANVGNLLLARGGPRPW
jgi:putative ABC transport system permease protein